MKKKEEEEKERGKQVVERSNTVAEKHEERERVVGRVSYIKVLNGYKNDNERTQERPKWRLNYCSITFYNIYNAHIEIGNEWMDI